MTSTIKKYTPALLLFLLLLLMPLDWYRQLNGNKSTFILEDVNGIFVFTQLYWVIAIIYFYSVLIQLVCIIYNNCILPLFTDLILAVSLTLFPTSMYDIRLSGTYFLTRFDYGYFLALAIIIGNMVINTKRFIAKKI